MEIIEIIKEFKKDVSTILKDKLDRVILFGSYARGDYDEESDVDILILVKEMPTLKEKEKIIKIASRYSLKYDILISPIIYKKTIRTSFIDEVESYGIEI